MAIPIPERKVYLHPWLAEQTITLVTGYRGTGKTWFALGIAKAISTGTKFGPWECRDVARVMHIDGELPLVDIKERIAGLEMDLDNPNLLFYLDAIAELNGLDRPNLGNHEWRERMLEMLTREKIDVAIYDNISALTSGIEENKAESWDPIADYLKTCRHRGVTSILLHHPNKSGDQRGTSKREDIISSSIVLKHPPGYTRDEGARFLVDFTKCRVSNRHLTLISDRDCRVIETADRHYRYQWSEPSKETNVLVLKLLNEGVAQKDIASFLDVSSGRISQIKSDLFKKKLIKTGKLGTIELTSDGERFLFNHDPEINRSIIPDF